jgi:hypothetical protein
MPDEAPSRRKRTLSWLNVHDGLLDPPVLAQTVR